MSRDRLRTTESPDGRTVATWRLVRRDCQVLNIQNREDSSPAYRWPSGAALPSAKPGLVILDGPPNLWEARDAFPRNADLWDAVRSDHWDVLLSRAELPVPITRA
ncbi:hypothetical protein OG874_25480 [Nocardia sp. NBC_00565]|uniref:hypothetical protein n=1 Tax=Nocardia sp. NBC_00565 TaxID=2975993 RepID=UPI002E80FF59|nr:hypothetical protein [Nocardia sp. NBC_00565]WUC00249.1 hypothetical protein OG874_25480 [Nocardia sp. NBC_00565]